MPYHCAGSAPGTPAAASRANCVAAQARTASSTAPAGAHDHRRAADRPAPRAPAPAVPGPVCRRRCRGRWPAGQARGRTARAASTSSPLSLSTAVTSRWVRARPMAAISNRRSSASSGALAEAPAPIPSSTSTSCWVPSTPPRGMVLGHNPSCSPAMTTSPTPGRAPRARSAPPPRRAPAARRAARRAQPNAATWSTRPRSDAPAVRVTYCSATSNSAVTASRSRSACAPAGPPRSLAASQRRCRPERCHACHSV